MDVVFSTCLCLKTTGQVCTLLAMLNNFPKFPEKAHNSHNFWAMFSSLNNAVDYSREQRSSVLPSFSLKWLH